MMCSTIMQKSTEILRVMGYANFINFHSKVVNNENLKCLVFLILYSPKNKVFHVEIVYTGIVHH
jgi:hypothetical protein